MEVAFVLRDYFEVSDLLQQLRMPKSERWVARRTKGSELTVASNVVFACFVAESFPSLDEVELLLNRERNGRSRSGERSGVRKAKLDVPSLRAPGRGLPGLSLREAVRWVFEVEVGAGTQSVSILFSAFVLSIPAIDEAVGRARRQCRVDGSRRG